MGRRARAPSSPPTVREQVERLLSDPVVAWLPVRHHSAGCAYHVDRWIRANRPAAVLIEGPDDAADLLPHLLHPDTRPPVAVLSVWTDTDGAVRTPGPDGPARFRALWPLVAHGPEWAALRAAVDVGAAVRLVDVPHDVLVKSLGGRPASGGAHAHEAAWFARLAERTGRVTFDAFFDATFEAQAGRRTDEEWFRELLTLGLCTRGEPDPALAEDGTLLREAHMAWHVAQARRAFPGGRLAVVTGAFHAVALADTPPRRAKAKGTKGITVVATPTSHASLVRLTGVSAPAFAAGLRAALDEGHPEPAVAAATAVLVRVASRLRAAGHPVGTADAVEAATLARSLARLRGGGPAAADVAEVATTAFLRGDASLGQGALGDLVRAVLAGDDRGELPPGAGRPPLSDDFFAEARRHRIDVSGASKVVRCDVARDEGHRLRSAFLHRASFLGLPVFEALPDGQGPPWFKGPDPLRGEGEHLLGETWGIRVADDVEDHLLALADRGSTLTEVAAAALGRLRADAGNDLRRRTEVVVTAARLRLAEVLPAALAELRAALPVSARFDERVYALRELVALHRQHTSLPTFGADEVGDLARRAFAAACVLLPELGDVRPEEVDDTLDDLQTLLRAPTVVDGFDEEALADALRATWTGRGAWVIRGAAAGAACARGELSERALAQLASAGFHGADAAAGAAFLEGVLRTSRAVLLGGRRLFGVVHEVLAGLKPDVFRAVLPDLRRAFAVFVPAELERLGEHVAHRLDPTPPAPAAAGPEVVARAARVDAEVTARLAAERGTEG